MRTLARLACVRGAEEEREPRAACRVPSVHGLKAMKAQGTRRMVAGTSRDPRPACHSADRGTRASTLSLSTLPSHLFPIPTQLSRFPFFHGARLIGRLPSSTTRDARTVAEGVADRPLLGLLWLVVGGDSTLPPPVLHGTTHATLLAPSSAASRPHFMSMSPTASTLGYQMQRRPNELQFTIATYFDAKKAQVSLGETTNGRPTLVVVGPVEKGTGGKRLGGKITLPRDVDTSRRIVIDTKHGLQVTLSLLV